MSTEYTLTYFDARGLIEPARFVLSYAGANWKDNRIPFVAPGQSPIPDEIKARLRFGQVPLLEFDGKKLVQSVAITRFLAKRLKLAGKDDFEAAQCDEIVDAVRDIFQLFVPFMREPDAEKKAAGLKEAAATARTKFLSKFNEIIQENGGHLVGSDFTFADFTVAHYLYQIPKVLGAELLTSDLSAVQGLVDKVFGAPGIKEWIAKRPDTQF